GNATFTSLSVSYTMACGSAGSTGGDPVFGHRIYYSRTGSAGDWHSGLIPDQLLSGPNTSAPKNFTLNGINWAPGSLLFIVWADDNGGPNPDGDFSIDDISFIPGFSTLGANLVTPANGSSFVDCANITALAGFSGSPTSANYFVDN